MKQFAQKCRKYHKELITVIWTLLLPRQAIAAGLSKAKGVLDTFKSELLTVIPVIAVIALVLLAIGYATKSVEKETFFRWAIGVIIAGSAAEITAMLFS